MKAYREWLPATSYEGSGSLGGSFYSRNIEDYYLTPHALGYGPFIRFDHDFIGREALEKVDSESQRKKVTFAWNSEDVTRVFRSLFELGELNYKYIDLPLSNYTSATYDQILSGGKLVGFSMFSGYSHNERSMLSLGVVDPDVEIGTEVTLVWGEEDGGTRKTTVERHRQMEIRAIVSPAPYSKVAREEYAEGWRTATAEA
jgi:vanillate/3-O-methylgallate O-demethylase